MTEIYLIRHAQAEGNRYHMMQGHWDGGVTALGRLYIQVAYLMPTEETREREFSALRTVLDQYEKIVLSMDRFDFPYGGIKHR